jgi:uncharacterized protein YndB with AHSA1/START domain
MSVTSVEKDLDNLTVTLVADFAATVEQVWQLWADPRKLERWWGPPTNPATFDRHDLRPGGEASFSMTGPEGEKSYGFWQIEAVDPPRSVSLRNGFADAEGNRNLEMPVLAMAMTLVDHEGGARMEIRATFATLEGMEEVLEMGFEQGLSEAVGQMDVLL